MIVTRRRDYDFNRLCKRRTFLRGKVSALYKTRREITVETKESQKEISAIDKELGDDEIKVSDHAILRYLERLGGLDIDRVVERMRIAEFSSALSDSNPGEKTFYRDGLYYIFQDRTLLTVSPTPGKPSKV